MTLIDDFNKIRSMLEATTMWSDMVACVENSPWHREPNVANHTDRVVQHYIDLCMPVALYSDRQKAIALLTLLFHDVGKPDAKQEVHSEERGTYVRFGGHEQISARLWENFAAEHWYLLADMFGFEPIDCYRITWAIEHHLPYAYRKHHKVQNIINGMHLILEDPEVYFHILESDCFGRVSDDHAAKKQDVFDYIANMRLQEPKEKGWDANMPTVFVMIGPSGSGKSTWLKGQQPKSPADVYSWDAIRLELAEQANLFEDADNEITRYKRAFIFCGSDPGRKKFMNLRRTKYMNLVKSDNPRDIIIDNTNMTSKSRAFLIDEAKKRGFKIIAVLFPKELLTLYARQRFRDDKVLDESTVEHQYMGIRMPQLGQEVDDVEIFGFPTLDQVRYELM